MDASLFPRLMNLIFTNFSFFFFNIYFFDVDHFLSLYGICYNTASVLCFVFLGPQVCGISVSKPGIKPAPPALECKVLTTAPPGKCQYLLIFQTGPSASTPTALCTPREDRWAWENREDQKEKEARWSHEWVENF